MTCQRMLRVGIAALAAMLALGTGVASADETCNSPYISKLIKGQEDYVYVWALGVEGVGDGSDKLVTVDVHPKSKNYGKVIASASVGGRGEAHHMGFTDDRRYLWAGGLAESKIHVFDIGTDPSKPKLGQTPFIGYGELSSRTEITMLEIVGAAVTTAPTGASCSWD